MAVDTKKITIEIIGPSESQDPTNVDPTDDTGSDKSKKTTSKSQIWLNMVAQRAKQVIITTIDTSANRYFYMKEDYLGEDLYRNIKANVNKSIGAVSAIAAGYKMGNFVGAGIAAVGTVINEGISIFNKYATLENQMNTLNYGMEFSRTRSGLIDNGRGTEN